MDCLKQALKTEWLFRFGVACSLVGKGMQFREENSAIWE